MEILIGNSIGEVIEIDGEKFSGWTGPCMRIKVRIDVTKPLQQGLKLKVNVKEKVWWTIKYEKLSVFCCHCGIILCWALLSCN